MDHIHSNRTLILLTITTNYYTDLPHFHVWIHFKDHPHNLFHNSVGFHRRRLREIFRAHYNPFNTNAVWSKDLYQRVLNDLRLHLFWDLGIRTFNWSKEAIGTRIIYRFKELGILLFMKKSLGMIWKTLNNFKYIHVHHTCDLLWSSL